MLNSTQIAVLIPCYNEALTIAEVVKAYRQALPNADIYVYDNNSTDNTAKIAQKTGAIVRHEARQGKGHTMRRMFEEVQADYYVLVDGDNTYPTNTLHQLFEPVLNGSADVCIGDRLSQGQYKNQRLLHPLGNRLIIWMINLLFKAQIKDALSGLRVMNRKFVKNVPILSSGFEVETSMTIYALHMGFVIQEIPISYHNRPAGSYSKLNTLKDGFKIILTIFLLLKDYKPLSFFGGLSCIFFGLSLALGVPVINEFWQTGLVPKLPSAVLAAGMMVISGLFFVCGLILNTIVRIQREHFQLWIKNRS